MGLFDVFRRRPAELPEHYVDLVRRVGRSEAEVERLSLIWVGYRDEIKRLVMRLEKRDYRATEREAKEAAAEAAPEIPGLDAVSQRILNRRNRVHSRNGP